jgi:hypothetical protein
MSNVRLVIDAGYASVSGPKSVGDATPNLSPVIRCRFKVWKKKTNLIFFSSMVFFSLLLLSVLFFIFCHLFLKKILKIFFTVFPFFVSCLSV